MNLETLTARDPEQNADSCSDAAKIIADALKANEANGVRFDDEVLETIDGDYVEFEFRVFAKVKRNRFAASMAQFATEDAGIQLLAASRAAAVAK